MAFKGNTHTHTHIAPWWPRPRSCKNESLKSMRNYRTLQMYQTYHYWFVAFKTNTCKNIHLSCFVLFSFCQLIFNCRKTTRVWCVSGVGRRQCRSWVFSVSSPFMTSVGRVKQTGLLMDPLNCTAHLHNPGATAPPLVLELTWWNGLIYNVMKQSPFFFPPSSWKLRQHFKAWRVS